MIHIFFKKLLMLETSRPVTLFKLFTSFKSM